MSERTATARRVRLHRPTAHGTATAARPAGDVPVSDAPVGDVPVSDVPADALHRVAVAGLVAVFVGFPLWWLIGVGELLPLAVGLLLGLDLLRRRRILLPPGTLWWAVFLLAVVASGALLAVDAPGAVPGGGAGRGVVWAYRLGWYLSATAVFLWVAGAERDDPSDRRLLRAVGALFVVTVIGGLAGVVAPRLGLRSLVELALPGGLAEDDFVRSLVHPATASVQRINGDEVTRPIAPFAFANSWGANLAMTLPFFVAGWTGRDAGWRRRVAPVVLVAAAVPVVASLNRGLWASLAVAGVVALVRATARRQAGALVAGTALVATVALVVLATPLAGVVAERLDNPHSNDRREQLLVQTVTTTIDGSPVLGFGSTRDVRGSYASIAGGATPDCPACSVPPLGTQGQLWLVVFAQGVVGVVAFVGFGVRQWRTTWRCRTTLETVATVALVTFGLQLFVYDTLGLPLLTLLLALGLVQREQRAAGADAGWTTSAEVAARLCAGWRTLAALTLAGALVGLAVGLARPPVQRATTAVLVVPAPVQLDRDGTAPGRDVTVDTEAALATARAPVAAAALAAGPGTDPTALRRDVEVTATPNSRVLHLSVVRPAAQDAVAAADALADAYLEVRGRTLERRRTATVAALTEQLSAVAGRDVRAADLGAGGWPSGAVGEPDGVDPDESAEALVRRALEEASVQAPVAGEVLRRATAAPVRRPIEVPVVSGAVLGLLAAAALLRRRPPARDER